MPVPVIAAAIGAGFAASLVSDVTSGTVINVTLEKIRTNHQETVMNTSIHFAVDTNAVTGTVIPLSTLCGATISTVEFVEGSLFTNDLGNAEKVTCRKCVRIITRHKESNMSNVIDTTCTDTTNTKENTVKHAPSAKEIAKAEAAMAKAQAILDAAAAAANEETLVYTVVEPSKTVRERIAPATEMAKGTAAATTLVAKAGVNTVLDMSPRQILVTTPKTGYRKLANRGHKAAGWVATKRDDAARARLGLNVEAH